MSKQDALDAIDDLVDGATHATLQTDPGVRIVDRLTAIRGLVDDIDEA